MTTNGNRVRIVEGERVVMKEPLNLKGLHGNVILQIPVRHLYRILLDNGLEIKAMRSDFLSAQKKRGILRTRSERNKKEKSRARSVFYESGPIRSETTLLA